MEVCFLLGSGVSKPVLEVDIDHITKSIFENRWRGRDPIFKECGTNEYESLLVSRIKKFLQIIRDEIGTSTQLLYHNNCIDFQINYEHIYHVCDNISNMDEIEKTNLLSLKFINEIRAKTRHIICDKYGKNVKLVDFAKRACEFIESVVFTHLIYEDEEFEFIRLFDELKKEGIKGHIFTLNHDLLVEKYFKSKDITYNDFFKNWDNSIRKFDINSVGDINGFDYCLYKLHGSVNWFRETSDFYGYYCIDKYCSDLLSFRENIPPQLRPAKFTPEILTGHTNKVIDYHHGIFSFLTNKFIEKLNKCNYVIVSGFGWKDYVIRQVLVEWLDHAKSRKIILAYKNDSDPKNFFNFSYKNSSIIKTNKWLSELSYSDISHLFAT